MRPHRRILVASLTVALGCGGKLVTEELARTTTGTRQGPADDPPLDAPPLVAIPSSLDGDAAALDGGCCGTILGWLYYPDRGCHDRNSVVAGCVVSSDAAACDPATATPSCVARLLADGGREVFTLASTWLPSSLSTAGLVSCADAAPTNMNEACNP